MGLVSLLWGIAALLWTLLAFLPMLGWGNWFMIPFAVVGSLIAAIGLLFTRSEKRGRASTGLTLNVLAIAIGIFRLVIGGGVF